MTKTINISKDFSRYPAGRNRSDGRFSGEAMREDLLMPALKAGKVAVELDGVAGYGSSFLEEAFGGLVRKRGYTFEQLKQLISLVSTDTLLVKEIQQYMFEASQPQLPGH